MLPDGSSVLKDSKTIGVQAPPAPQKGTFTEEVLWCFVCGTYDSADHHKSQVHLNRGTTPRIAVLSAEDQENVRNNLQSRKEELEFPYRETGLVHVDFLEKGRHDRVHSLLRRSDS